MQTVATLAFENKTQLFSAFCNILTCNGNTFGRQVQSVTVQAYICHYILQSSMNVRVLHFLGIQFHIHTQVTTLSNSLTSRKSIF